MEDTFFLDTNEGSIECRVITNLYSEKRKKHYLVYEYVDEKNDDLYVSSYDPEDETNTLNDVSDSDELREVTELFESMM